MPVAARCTIIYSHLLLAVLITLLVLVLIPPLAGRSASHAVQSGTRQPQQVKPDILVPICLEEQLVQAHSVPTDTTGTPFVYFGSIMPTMGESLNWHGLCKLSGPGSVAPAELADWARYGYSGTVTAGEILGIAWGDIGSSFTASLQQNIYEHARRDAGGTYTIFTVPAFDTYIPGSPTGEAHVSRLVYLKTYIQDVGADALLGRVVTTTLDSTVPIARLSTTQLEFGSQAVGTTSITQTVTLTNTGDQYMLIDQIAVDGDFTQTSDCPISPATLTLDAACTITVSFTPTELGEHIGTLFIYDDAVDTPQVVHLSGTGLPAPTATPTETPTPTPTATLMPTTTPSPTPTLTRTPEPVALPVPGKPEVSSPPNATYAIISWDAVGSRYLVEYAASGSAWQPYQTVVTNSVVFTGEPGTTYTFRVRVSAAAGMTGDPSPWSEPWTCGSGDPRMWMYLPLLLSHPTQGW